MIKTRLGYIVTCLILYAIAMTGWWFFTNWIVNAFGWWIAIPICMVGLLIGWLIDRHTKRAEQGEIQPGRNRHT
jgi:hypothetical protein